MKKTRYLLAAVALTVTTSSAALASPKKDTVYVPLNVWTSVALNKGWLQEEYAKVGSKVEAVDTAAIKVPGVEASLLEKGELHFFDCSHQAAKRSARRWPAGKRCGELFSLRASPASYGFELTCRNNS